MGWVFVWGARGEKKPKLQPGEGRFSLWREGKKSY